MPLPNGVTPLGSIDPTCPSAAWMGHRGILHDTEGRIVKASQHNHWVTCALDYKGRNRKPLMQPGRYSELFFLDEATAFAAGHRPCGECRRSRYMEFTKAWEAAHGRPYAIGEIDRGLHGCRRADPNARPLWAATIGDLPVGAMFMMDAGAYLVSHRGASKWTPRGYVDDPRVRALADVDVLAPKPLVEVLKAGYAVQLHPSAECL